MMDTGGKKSLKIILLSVFFILIIVYAFFRSKDLLLGVKLRGVNLANGVKVGSNILEVSGNAKNAVLLTLNGREILIDQEGNWKETLVLLRGYNVVNLKAEDKFGNSDEKNYQLMY